MRINISSSPQDAGLVFFIYSSCYDIWIPQICFLPWFPPLWLCCSTEMCPSFERPVDSAHLSQTLTLLKPCSLQFLLWLTEDLLALLTYTADTVASSQEIMVKNCSWTEGGALVPASGTLRTWSQLLESQPAHDTSVFCLYSSPCGFGWCPGPALRGGVWPPVSHASAQLRSAFCGGLSCRISYEKRLPLLYESSKITLLIHLLF